MTLLKQRVRRSVDAFEARLEPRINLVPGVLGDGAGTVVVPGRANFLYVRLRGMGDAVFEALNASAVPETEGIPVDLREVRIHGQERVYVIVGTSISILKQGAASFGVPLHGPTHEWTPGDPGRDIFNLYKRSVTELRAQEQVPADMTLQVSAGWYWDGTVVRYFIGGDSPSFTAPSSGFRYDLLYLNPGPGTLTMQEGGALPSAEPPLGTVPIAIAKVSSTTTTITEAIILDARLLVGSLPSAIASHDHSSASEGGGPLDEANTHANPTTGAHHAQAHGPGDHSDRAQVVDFVLYDATNGVALPDTDVHGSLGAQAHFDCPDAVSTWIKSWPITLPLSFVLNQTPALYIMWSSTAGGGSVKLRMQLYELRDNRTVYSQRLNVYWTVAAPAVANTTEITAPSAGSQPYNGVQWYAAIERDGAADSNNGIVSIHAAWLRFTADQ